MAVPGFSAEMSLHPAFATVPMAGRAEALPCLYGNWCGPGCSGPGPAVDDLDACCQTHDRCYDQRGWGACSCDRELMGCVWPKISLWTGKGRMALGVWYYFSHGWCNPFA